MADLVPLLEQIINATAIVRLRDRDELTDKQVAEANKQGVRVLTEFRNLETLLLSDDILLKLCMKHDNENAFDSVRKTRDEALAKSVAGGNASDDLKPTAQAVHHAVKRELSISRSGSTKEAFMRDYLAPLVTSDMEVYQRLKNDIFENAH